MIKTEYMGLELRSPVIIASGPLTQNIVSLKKCEEALKLMFRRKSRVMLITFSIHLQRISLLHLLVITT